VDMKRHTIPLLPAVILMIALFASCQNVEENTTYPAELQGWVYDDSTRKPVPAVLVTGKDFIINAYTNDSGRFYVARIEMPRDETNEIIICTKTGYDTAKATVYLRAQQLNTIDTVLIKKSSK
jgi:hypothetical protein